MFKACFLWFFFSSRYHKVLPVDCYSHIIMFLYVAMKKVRYKQFFFVHNTNKIPYYYPFIISFRSFSVFCCLFRITRVLLLVGCWCTFGFLKLTHTSAATATIGCISKFFFVFVFCLLFCYFIHNILLDSSITNVQGCFLLSVLSFNMNGSPCLLHALMNRLFLIKWVFRISFGFGFG